MAERSGRLVWSHSVGGFDETTGVYAMRRNDAEFAGGQEAGMENDITIARAGVHFGPGIEAAPD